MHSCFLSIFSVLHLLSGSFLNVVI